MTLEDFSNEFDILYDNIMSNQAPGLNEYEKSIFLTKAQDEILKNYFNPKGNKYNEGYDDSRKRYTDFSDSIAEYSSNDYYEGFIPENLYVPDTKSTRYATLNTNEDWFIK